MSWRCCGCGAASVDLLPACDCSTRLMYDSNDRDRVKTVRWHEWIEVGDRRWCVECESFQTRQRGQWRDAMVGKYPAYNKTDLSLHRAL